MVGFLGYFGGASAHAQLSAQQLRQQLASQGGKASQWNGPVQPPDGLAQQAHQHHIAERLPLCRRFTGGLLGAGEDGIAQILEPAQGGVFDGGFPEAHVIDVLGKILVVALVEGWSSAFQDIHDSAVNDWVFN